MKYIPFNIYNCEIDEPSRIPAYIAEVAWHGKIVNIRVGWGFDNCQDRAHFRKEMLRLKDWFAEHPEWNRKIKKQKAHKTDPTEELWPRFMYFPLPESDYYWV